MQAVVRKRCSRARREIALTAVERKVDQERGAAEGRDRNPAGEGPRVCRRPGGAADMSRIRLDWHLPFNHNVSTVPLRRTPRPN
jgi:hypothetical protein